MLVPSLLAVIVLAAVHLVVPRMGVLTDPPRSRWLSFAGGVSVAYVFVWLLPELSLRQAVIGTATPPALSFLENHIYIIALLGLLGFYGLEHMVRTAPGAPRGDTPEAAALSRIFWAHILAFGVYNVLIAYLILHREPPGLASLLLFAIAIGLHLIVIDLDLLEHHRQEYLKPGRFILAGALLLGWLLGSVTEVSEVIIAILLSFLAGSIILIALKEELPEERQSRIGPFFVGAVGYTLLLLTL